MCSINNKELLLAGTALKRYQGLSPIPGYSAFTATCNIAHHSSVQREYWGEANSDQRTTPSLQGHWSPSCKSLLSMQGIFSFKCASRADYGITPVVSKENEPTWKCPTSLFIWVQPEWKYSKEHDHGYFHQQSWEAEKQLRTILWQSLLSATQMHNEQDVFSPPKYTLRV